jgi:tRNA/rRNA methyltransferase/tRNA (cytidine32/uridine32-2'-O)-methyltransferase
MSGAGGTSALGRVHVVLVGTTHPGNIGAAARAMKTMGLERLTLVAPLRFPDPEATTRASGADDLLERARVVDDLDAALAPCRLVVGTSARARSLRWPEWDPRLAARRLLEAVGAGGEVALVFGRERTGLSNAELERCHALVRIPANPDFASLNLAAAVQLMAWELRVAAGDALWGERYEDPDPPATAAELAHLYSHAERALVALEFLDPDNPKQLMRRLRRLCARARPSSREVEILRGILAAAERGPRRGR